MKTIEGMLTLLFPETIEEADKWTPFIQHIALDKEVLAVMKTRVEGTWAAYIGAVPGIDHKRERNEVLEYGTKLPAKLAESLFHFPAERYAL